MSREVRTFKKPYPLAESDFYAHRASCRFCTTGRVMMHRDVATRELRPDWCWCINCNQPYTCKVADIEAFETAQENQRRSYRRCLPARRRP